MTYGELRAVDGVTSRSPRASSSASSGPNGAGKTTTLEMIEGLRKPDAGTVTRARRVPVWPRNPGCCRGSASSSRPRRSSSG